MARAGAVATTLWVGAVARPCLATPGATLLCRRLLRPVLRRPRPRFRLRLLPGFTALVAGLRLPQRQQLAA
eukprot:2763688-Lingulodinium_polyedra.AAC.1